MVQKGTIKEIDLQTRRAYVTIPIFQNAGCPEEYIFVCPFAYQPGSTNGYAVGDIVYVGFENDQIDYPFILGKLYTKTEQSAETAFKGNSLEISGKTVLSDDTKIGDITYDMLVAIVSQTEALSNNMEVANNAIENLSKKDAVAASDALSAGSTDLGVIAYEQINNPDTGLLVTMDNMKNRLSEIEELLKEIIYIDIEIISDPVWVLTNEGYKIQVTVRNVDTNEEHVEYVMDNMFWKPYDYCNFNEDGTPLINKNFNKVELLPNSDTATTISIRPQGSTELLGSDGWITNDWAKELSGTSGSYTGNVNMSGFPLMGYDKIKDKIPKSYLLVSLDPEGKSKAYGTKLHYLDINMLNRADSGIFSKPNNINLTIPNPQDVAHSVQILDNIWYDSPPLISDWQPTFSGYAYNTFDASTGVYIGNVWDYKGNFKFNVGKIKKQLMVKTSDGQEINLPASIRFLLKFTFSGEVISYNSVSGSSEGMQIQETIIDFTDDKEFRLSSKDLLLVTDPNKDETTIDVNVMPVIYDGLKRYFTGPAYANTDFKIVSALIANTAIKPDGFEPYRTYINKPDPDNPSGNPCVSTVRLKNIILEYYYVPSTVHETFFSKCPVSLPVKYKLVDNHKILQKEQLFNSSNYQTVCGNDGVLPPLNTGDKLRAPIINSVKLLKINSNGTSILSGIRIEKLTNTNNLKDKKYAEEIINLTSGKTGKAVIYLAQYNVSNSGHSAQLKISEGFSQTGYLELPITFEVKNAYYSNLNSQDEYEVDVDKWSLLPFIIDINIQIPSEYSTKIADTDVFTLMGIRFQKNGYLDSDILYFSNLEWDNLLTKDESNLTGLASTLKYIPGSDARENWQKFVGTVPFEIIQGNAKNIKFDVDLSADKAKITYDQSSYNNLFFIPSILPTPEVLAAGQSLGYEFNNWYYITADSKVINVQGGEPLHNLPGNEITLKAAWIRKTEEVSFVTYNNYTGDPDNGHIIIMSNANYFPGSGESHDSFDVKIFDNYKEITVTYNIPYGENIKHWLSIADNRASGTIKNGGNFKAALLQELTNNNFIEVGKEKTLFLGYYKTEDAGQYYFNVNQNKIMAKSSERAPGDGTVGNWGTDSYRWQYYYINGDNENIDFSSSQSDFIFTGKNLSINKRTFKLQVIRKIPVQITCKLTPDKQSVEEIINLYDSDSPVLPYESKYRNILNLSGTRAEFGSIISENPRYCIGGNLTDWLKYNYVRYNNNQIKVGEATNLNAQLLRENNFKFQADVEHKYNKVTFYRQKIGYDPDYLSEVYKPVNSTLTSADLPEDIKQAPEGCVIRKLLVNWEYEGSDPSSFSFNTQQSDVQICQVYEEAIRTVNFDAYLYDTSCGVVWGQPLSNPIRGTNIRDIDVTGDDKHDFDHWETYSSGSESGKTIDANYVPEQVYSDLNVKAVYRYKPKADVLIYSIDGTLYERFDNVLLSKSIGEQNAYPEDPKITGADFDGWFDSNGNQYTYSSVLPSSAAGPSFELSARYTYKNYNVYFEWDGSKLSVPVSGNYRTTVTHGNWVTDADYGKAVNNATEFGRNVVIHPDTSTTKYLEFKYFHGLSHQMPIYHDSTFTADFDIIEIKEE